MLNDIKALFYLRDAIRARIDSHRNDRMFLRRRIIPLRAGYAADHVAGLVVEVTKYAYEVTNYYLSLSLARLVEIYNGCGPDWLSSTIRAKLTGYLDFFESCFLPHDVDFDDSDRTRDGFDAANLRLWRNCRRKIAAELSWWRPAKKAAHYAAAWIIYRACVDFGWSAWSD